jgi:ABC-type spermidine/putrescine transport system permease subunit I
VKIDPAAIPGIASGRTTLVYSQQGAIGNMPMAAAFTLVPIVLIALYLAFVKGTRVRVQSASKAPRRFTNAR